ncbi:AGPS [Symbiodinium sp. KB8]|nr:AGPS [Symbiodinium sp. KB8]
MVAATLLFEGTKEEVEAQQKAVYEIGRKYGGIKGGEQNGIRGYFLTYMIAYLRDYAMRYGFIAESFETSVPWSNVLSLCHDVKARIHRECKAVGVKKTPFVSCRVTQAYDTGAAVYFYFGFSWVGLDDPELAFTRVSHLLPLMLTPLSPRCLWFTYRSSELQETKYWLTADLCHTTTVCSVYVFTALQQP